VRTRIGRFTLVVPMLLASLALVATTASASGPSRSAAAARVRGAQRFDGGWAVPISTRGPSWYDARYFHRVMRAGGDGARLPRGVSMPHAAGLAYPGIRPGLWLVTVTANSKQIGFAWCTANFVFTKNGAYGLGTAGHCAARDALGAAPDVTAYVVPPPTSGKLPGFYHIGKFVLSHNNGIGDDFAMIQIYSQYNGWVNPTMEVWGGPQGVYTSTLPTVVKWFGHGVVVGTGGTARAGVAPIWTARNGTAFAWYGPSTPGDSGSGVEAIGTAGPDLAAGDLTHFVIFDGKISCSSRTCTVSPGEILPGMMAGTKMATILQIANGWSLVNGSLLPVP
jgi:hypothetical protein